MIVIMDRCKEITGFISLAPGVGPAKADKIFGLYKGDTLDQIAADPAKVANDTGYPVKIIESIKQLIDEQNYPAEYARLSHWLKGLGFRRGLAEEILARTKDGACECVKENPFRLRVHFRGEDRNGNSLKAPSVKMCDKLFLRLGGDPKSEIRLSAHLYDLIDKDPSTWFDRDDLKTLLLDLTGADTDTAPAIKRQMDRKGLVQRGALFTNPIYDKWESQIANDICRLNSDPSSWPNFSGLTGVSDEQRGAITEATSENVGLLVGSAGTGKTTCTAEITKLLIQQGYRFAMTATTGAAVQQIVNKLPMDVHACTAHSFLDGRKGADGFFKFGYHEDRPVEYDIVMVDESSMAGLEIVAGLLRAIPTGAGVMFIGDDAQLPSVDKGNFLRDAIRGNVPTGRLKRIHRNAGAIAEVAALIRERKQFPTPRLGTRSIEKLDSNFWCQPCPLDKITDVLLDLYHRLRAAGFENDDIAVIAGTNKFRLPINDFLQDLFNPGGEPFGSRGFRLGDRIIRTERNVFVSCSTASDGQLYLPKSQMATISDIDSKEQTATLLLPSGHQLVMDWNQVEKEFSLAYIKTAHKAQGSESKVVIVVSTPRDRNFDGTWAYTSVTRAQELCIVIGNVREFESAAMRTYSIQAKTLLAEKLKGIEEC